ncbi:PPC domain-containing protein [Stigmatella aurantiaca]|uniref:PPC domain-containing protein n=1 Tax=Stigmatella aurantiaca TaxID=41 RepID=UPI003CCBE025
MKKFVFCLLSIGAWACGPADEVQQSEAQDIPQEVVLETPAQVVKSGGVQTQGAYEWVNRSSSTCGSWQYFPISVPENTPALLVYSQYGTVGASYGADLFLAWGFRPSGGSYHGSSATAGTNAEFISISNPSPGTWWIGLQANCSYSGVTVGAVY